MTRLIRRHSMERLELYDLDKLIAVPATNYSVPSPLPPPIRQTPPRRSSMNPAYERYKFLCNMSRNQTDPIYAATPMFTTIPQSAQEHSHRQLLGSYVRLENVRPLSPKMPKSLETKKAEIIEEEKENEDFQVEEEKPTDDKEDHISDDDGSGSGSGSRSGSISSSSSDGDNERNDDDGDGDDDDDAHKSIIEQIFNRDKENRD